MNTYAAGQLVRCSVAFTNGAGAAADPTTTTFRVRAPSGTITTWVAGVDAQLVKDATGAFHVDVTADAAGVWSWEFVGIGAVTAAMPSGEFDVRGSLLDTVRVAYASVADFREGWDTPPGAERDGRITTKLAEGSSLIDAEVGFGFGRSGSEARLFDASGGSRLHAHAGLVTVSLVEVRSSAGAAWEALGAGDWVLAPYALAAGETHDHVILTGGVWPAGRATVRITGQHGYGAVPTRVRRAVVAYARESYRLDATAGGSAIGPEEFGATMPRQLWPRDVFDCVAHYHRLYLGCTV